MNKRQALEFWFVTGSQDLYGEEVLKEVERDSKKIVESLNESGVLPYQLVYKPAQISSTQIRATMAEAGSDQNCGGVICWMHTFSPAKMWIAGLSILSKPLLHLHTQFNERIPYETIDMDFMNLNQSAHGDREFGHITARMNIRRTVIAGHWNHAVTQQRIANWMRSASAVIESNSLTIVRFGDNMREVAVTDGDKLEAMIKLNWSAPFYGIGDLVDYKNRVTDSDVNSLVDEYRSLYTFKYTSSEREFLKQVEEQARIEIALERFLGDVGAKAFTTTFQDLHGMSQLPGLACQRLMSKGYGFGAEGDWKTAAMVRLLKVMGKELEGGETFMEDYTYHLEEGNMLNLGAHMLEICPSVAKEKPTLEVHALGIGEREDPARLVFDGRPGPAFCVALVDMGNRFRMVLQKVEAVATPKAFEKLPVARILWKPLPNLITSSEAWILAGGGHHTVYSDSLQAEHLRTFAEMVDIEYLEINEKTSIAEFRNEMRWNSVYY